MGKQDESCVVVESCFPSHSRCLMLQLLLLLPRRYSVELHRGTAETHWMSSYPFFHIRYRTVYRIDYAMLTTALFCH